MLSKPLETHVVNYRCLEIDPMCLLSERLQQRFPNHRFLEMNPTCNRHIWSHTLPTTVSWKTNRMCYQNVWNHTCLATAFWRVMRCVIGTCGIALP